MKAKRIELTEESDHGNPKYRQYRPFLSAVFYAVMSVSTVFLNKAIFRVHAFKFPATLVAGQMGFTLVLVTVMQQLGLVRKFHFNFTHFKRVGWLSFFFMLKLLLDMSALAVVNIPMYGVLKSSTTPCVMFLDYILRGKVATNRVQLAVFTITFGGFVAGLGDLTFDLSGYILALSSAMSTAAYVVLVGKLAEDLKMDSWMLLFYNCCWSLPMSLIIIIPTGEASKILEFPNLYSSSFLACYTSSCASACVLNWATYMCTLENDSLTTSVVGRTKSIVQSLGGLFAFGDVKISALNLSGLAVNSSGILWYAVEKAREQRAREVKETKSVETEIEKGAVDVGSKGGSFRATIHEKVLLSDLKRDSSQITMVSPRNAR
mmetsp:Transcript_38555/g.53538  ORF Transcript_38555/g.53538 Transcript_38555/m.53538 type:complete len:376 (+) Transcript_38555:332-1459(+)